MSAKSGLLSTACVQLGLRNLSVIRSSRVSAIQGCLSVEVNGRAVGTFRIVRYIVGVRYSGVSVKWGSTVYTQTLFYHHCFSQESNNT